MEEARYVALVTRLFSEFFHVVDPQSFLFDLLRGGPEAGRERLCRARPRAPTRHVPALRRARHGQHRPPTRHRGLPAGDERAGWEEVRASRAQEPEFKLAQETIALEQALLELSPEAVSCVEGPAQPWGQRLYTLWRQLVPIEAD